MGNWAFLWSYLRRQHSRRRGGQPRVLPVHAGPGSRDPGVLRGAPATGPHRLDPACDPETELDLLHRSWAGGTARRVTVAELASGLGLSRSQVARLITDRCGVGPARAIELLRLARAASLLGRTNLTVANIALLYGFADPFHLTKRFRATYGTAPGHYRRSGGPDRSAVLASRSGALVDLDRWLTKPDLIVGQEHQRASA